MTAGWTNFTLGEVAPLNYGRALPATTRVEGDIPVFSSAGQTGTHNSAFVQGPAVIVGRKGNVGSVYFSEKDSFPIDTTFYTRGTTLVDLKFVYYKLQSLGLSNLSRDSAVPGLSRAEYNRVRTLFPAKREQMAIAEVLSALDAKIASNTALTHVADELMHQIFRSLKPSTDQPLSATAEFVNGKAFTKGASGTGRVVVRIAELNGGIGGSTVFSDAVVDDKHVARPGDILFAWSGSLTLHRWFRDEAIVNQHIFKVIPREGYPAWLVYELIREKLAEFKSIAADKATTMGHIQRRHLDGLVGIPSGLALEAHGALLGSLWDAALTAEQESLTLAAMRDTLLPELMSGKLRIREAELLVSEAGI